VCLGPLCVPRPHPDREEFLRGSPKLFAIGISRSGAVHFHRRDNLSGVLALMTPYLQTLMGYPIVTRGACHGPRAFGAMVCMFLVGRVIGRVDTRALLVIGLLLTHGQ